MKINEKIDFLMKLTNTPNSVLGKFLTFDASYISRIRSGKRSLPKNQPFLEPASQFFAEHLIDSYQKKMANEFICPGKEWPDNQRTAQKLIFQWLSQPEGQMPVGQILSGIASMKGNGISPVPEVHTSTSDLQKEVEFFYGNKGKQEAVSKFLEELIQMEKPPQLLLYSNEEFSWMYEDPEYAKKWALMLFGYIAKGGRIKIAHTISRANGEMLMALQKWIPVYMTGAVEPYYYPKILDRVFRKTLFIAEGHSAIMASSVGEHVNGAFNCLIREPEAVRSLESEFWEFFEICKPLMQIFNVAARDKFFNVLQNFGQESCDMFTVRTTPSFYTMPLEVARSMNERDKSGWILKKRESAEAAFTEMMESGCEYTELLNLPGEKEIIAGQAAFPLCDLIEKSGLYYTAEEFALHLDSVIEKMKKYEHYHVVLTSAIPANELVYVKEDLGVILIKSDFPSIAFVINEQRMVSAFWNYLCEVSENGKKKEQTIRILERLRQKLL